jgi:hypothetical protein
MCVRIRYRFRELATKDTQSEPPSFHGVNDIEVFFTHYEDEVLEK